MLLDAAARKVMDGAEQARNRARVARVREWTAEAEQALSDNPVYMARNTMRKKDGFLDADAIVAAFGEETLSALRKKAGLGVARKNGIDPDLFAEQFGFTDGVEMIRAILDSPTKTEAVREYVAAKELAHDIEAVNVSELLVDTQEAGEAVAMAGEWLARAVKSESILQTVITAKASLQLDGMAMREARNPERFMAAYLRARRNEGAALARGDFAAALEHNTQARINMEIARQSRVIAREVDRIEAYAKRLRKMKPGVVPDAIREAIGHVLATYSLVPQKGEGSPHVNLREVVNNILTKELNDAQPDLADWVLDGRDPNNGAAYGEIAFRDLTYRQGQDVHDVLRFFDHMGRAENAERKGSLAARVKEAAEEGAAPMRNIKSDKRADKGSALRKFQDWKAGLWGNVTALQWQFRAADGYVSIGRDGTAGVNEIGLMDNQIVAGDVRARQRMGGIVRELAPVFDRLKRDALKYKKALMVKDRYGNNIEVPQSIADNHHNYWTIDMVYELALNLGNESNIARVKSGYGDLKVETVAALLGDDAARLLFPEHKGKGQSGILTAQNWKDLNTIWKVINSQWADTQAVHERMYGFKPKGIDAAPFTLNIHGETLNVDGGYFPIKYDRSLSQRADNLNEKQDILARTESSSVIPAAKRGHTKSRTDGAPGIPIRLDTGVIMEHLNEVVTFIELGEAVRFVDRVTQNKDWQSEFIRTEGRENYNAIRKNLSGIVKQEVAPDSFVIKAADIVRPFIIYSGLAYNLKTALFQLSNIVPAMGEVGTANMVSSLGIMATRGTALTREIASVDPYMKDRVNSIDQDLRTARNQIDPSMRDLGIDVGDTRITLGAVAEIGMLPMLAMDGIAANAIWFGKYRENMSKLSGQKYDKSGVDPTSQWHEQSVVAARNAVKRLVPDFDGSSRCQFLRDKGAMRLLNMFSSNSILFAQRRAFHHRAWDKGQLSTSDYIRYHAYDFVFQGVACAVMFAMVRGFSDDSEERSEQIRNSLLAGVADTYAMALPVVGPLLSRAILGEGGRPSGIRTLFDSPVDTVSKVASAGRKVATSGFDADANIEMARATLGLASFLAKIPADRIIRRAERGYEQWQDGEGGPGLMLMPR